MRLGRIVGSAGVGGVNQELTGPQGLVRFRGVWQDGSGLAGVQGVGEGW